MYDIKAKLPWFKYVFLALNEWCIYYGNDSLIAFICANEYSAMKVNYVHDHITGSLSLYKCVYLTCEWVVNILWIALVYICMSDNVYMRLYG